jgi:hypothetical protein
MYIIYTFPLKQRREENPHQLFFEKRLLPRKIEYMGEKKRRNILFLPIYTLLLGGLLQTFSRKMQLFFNPLILNETIFKKMYAVLIPMYVYIVGSKASSS